jgi:CrcB protein
MLKNVFIVGLGGAIGTVGRFLIYQLIKTNSSFWVTLGINILGSFLIGVLLGMGLRNSNFETNWKVFLATGVCGGFTTFSAFSIENIQLLEQGKWMACLLYITGSVILGISAAFGGYRLITLF